MQIKETTNEGLKRGYTLTIPGDDIAGRIDAEVKKIAPQVKMPGFRPGKVPANLVRKMHGEQLHAQTLNDTIRASVDELIKDKSLRPAMQPAVNLEEGYEEGRDAVVTVDLEVLPKIDTPDIDNLKLERLTVPVSDDAVDESLQNIAGQQKSYKDAPQEPQGQGWRPADHRFHRIDRWRGIPKAAKAERRPAGHRCGPVHPRFRRTADRRGKPAIRKPSRSRSPMIIQPTILKGKRRPVRYRREASEGRRRHQAGR